MTPEAFYNIARQTVYDYVKPRLEKTDTHVSFVLEDVYVVWACYILGNWKCMISTSLPDGMYYEVTYNEKPGEIYLDAYKKFENITAAEIYKEVD